MPAIAPAVLINSILNAIQQSGGSGVYLSAPHVVHPRIFAVDYFERPFTLWVYIWTLTRGGRSTLPNEYRIQMTSVQSPLPYKADHALVVAPGFEAGAIVTRCTEQKVTPMKACDLGKLLEYTVEFGAIPITKIREVFQFYDPQMVSGWVEELGKWLKEQRLLTIDIFLRALQNLKGRVPDALPAAMIAIECRERLSAVTVKEEDVISVARGLSILVPDLVGIDDDKIVVNASADRVAAAVAKQLEDLRSEQVIEGENGGAQL